jgi:hypothetical protein
VVLSLKCFALNTGIVACARPGLGRFAGGDRIGMPLADTEQADARKEHGQRGRAREPPAARGNPGVAEGRR